MGGSSGHDTDDIHVARTGRALRSIHLPLWSKHVSAGGRAIESDVRKVPEQPQPLAEK